MEAIPLSLLLNILDFKNGHPGSANKQVPLIEITTNHQTYHESMHESTFL